MDKALYELQAISPIDGRYAKDTQSLSDIFSEAALINHRIIIEGEYLIYLSEHGRIELEPFTLAEKTLVRDLYNPNLEDLIVVKEIETKGYKDIKRTNHDVKAVEYFLKDRLKDTPLEESLEWIHFCLTSEDVNNIAYAMMLRRGIEEIIIPELTTVFDKIEEFAQKYKEIPMLARTHGQPASPTTFGKEFKVYSSRLKRQITQLENSEILVKLNGATGNYNALVAAYPDIPMGEFTESFIKRFNDQSWKIKLKPNFITTQIEPHDSYAEIFDNLRRVNTILMGFDQDIWRYISDDWIVQKPVEGEIGSSTMPHKVNPIDFENSEGNLGLANVLFNFFSSKLPISRLQRDLSDSTVERNFGVAFAHSLVAYKSTLKGLDKVSVNEHKVIKDLEEHPEVITEAIQTILKTDGFLMPYERLKEITRGKKISMGELHEFIEHLEVSDELKSVLKEITPSNYTGVAKYLVDIKI